jgi:uncharacterized protein (TIGR02117 family)
LLLVTANLGACAAHPPPCVSATIPPDNVVYLMKHGWHTDIAIPSDELRGNMTVFQRIFPGAEIFVIGFGKRTFMTSRVHTSGDLVVGPFPGPGLVLVTALSAPPDVAYDDGLMARLTLPPGGAEGLSDFVWKTLKTEHGVPQEMRPGFYPGSIFYLTETRYAGTRTCNTWTADALRAAGLHIDPAGDIFSGQTMSQAEHLAGGACSIKGRP